MGKVEVAQDSQADGPRDGSGGHGKSVETEYRALYSKDVNNYVAIKPNGEIKLVEDDLNRARLIFKDQS